MRATLFSVFTIFCLVNCTSARNYSCKIPNGVRCMSTRDVYLSSNDSNANRPTSHQAGLEFIQNDPSKILALPSTNTPVRTAAQIMRIWVAPWQDVKGDLIMSGFIFTEVESRKWVYGFPADSQNFSTKRAPLIR